MKTPNLPKSHPLDECDPGELYQTMMSERAALIAARREAEDSLVKTIIQLSAALTVLLAGFVSQKDVTLAGWPLVFFCISLAALLVAISSGLAEHRYSSNAYAEQIQSVEDFYTKKVDNWAEAPSNKKVRAFQLCSFAAFLAALVSVGLFAVSEVTREKYVTQNNDKGSGKGKKTASTQGDSKSPKNNQTRSSAPNMPPPPPPSKK